VLVLSFGGPDRTEDVMPFLENVLRGKNVPRERMLEVAEHYYHFGGKSPINGQNRALVAALEKLFEEQGPKLPVYWGNRNWHPLLADTLRQMQADGVRRALAFATSAFGSYPGCRQYREEIDRARSEVGAGAPEVHKLRTFHNHPGFLKAMSDRVRAALDQVPDSRRGAARLIFTAHSIPVGMAETSPYVSQLSEACELVGRTVGHAGVLVYQSRSGPPSQPWLGPDVGDAIRQLYSEGVNQLVIAPIGFLSDHMEVAYDLDTEAAHLCEQLGIHMVRAGTVGGHPALIAMVRDLVLERIELREPPCDTCGPACCPPPRRPAAPVRPAAEA
jgi:ferrochelatase